MSAPTTSEAPRLEAVINANGTGYVTMNGSRREIRTNSEDEARLRAVDLAVEAAQIYRQPLEMDVTDHEGHAVVDVYPDGKFKARAPGAAPPVKEAGKAAEWPPPTPPAPTAAPTPAPAAPAPTPTPTPAAGPVGRAEATVTTMSERAASAATGRPFPPPPVPATPPAAPAGPSGRQPGPLIQPPPVELPRQVTAPVAPPTVGRAAADPRPEIPGLRELRDTREQARGGAAEQGWQAVVHRLTAGAVSPTPGKKEMALRVQRRAIQRPLTTTRLIVVANPTGGVGKTSLSLGLACEFGQNRSNGVLAWDINPNKGTLGMRALNDLGQELTAEDLLGALPEFLAGRPLSDLDTFVRPQGRQRFEVLAAPRKAKRGAGPDVDDGDENAWMRQEAGWVIGWDEFHALYPWLAAYYRVIIADTGNKQDPVWWASMTRAHQLVLPLSLSEHSLDVILDTCDDLEEAGFTHLVRNAVTVITPMGEMRGRKRRAQRERVHRFLGPQGSEPGRTRTVLELPPDPGLAGGVQADYERMTSRAQLRRIAAAVADGL